MSSAKPGSQTPAERRAAEAALRGLVATHASKHARLFDAARRWVQQRLPTAHELAYEYTSWIVTSYSPDDRGYVGVLAVRADADGVKLYFNRGKGLPDPAKLLRGTAQTRWIAVDSPATLARPEVARLADAALAQNETPFPRSGPGPLVIRAKSAKAAKNVKSATNVKSVKTVKTAKKAKTAAPRKRSAHRSVSPRR